VCFMSIWFPPRPTNDDVRPLRATDRVFDGSHFGNHCESAFIIIIIMRNVNRSLAPPSHYAVYVCVYVRACVRAYVHSTHAGRPRNSYDVIRPDGRTIWRGSGRTPSTGSVAPAYLRCTFAVRRPRQSPGRASRPGGRPRKRDHVCMSRAPVTTLAAVVRK